MAFPLVPGSHSGVINKNVTVPVLAINYTRAWEPIPPRGRSAVVNIDQGIIPVNSFSGTRVWSGAKITTTWPAYGQGWPRIVQR